VGVTAEAAIVAGPAAVAEPAALAEPAAVAEAAVVAEATAVAEATVVAERCGPLTRCTTLRCAPPLTLRNTPDGLYLVGTTAGPIGGDRTRLNLDVGDGAELVVRSAAAQILLPGPQLGPSTATVVVSVGRGARLRWEPEPVIAVRRADHRMATELVVGEDADVVWREEIVLGRAGEESGSVQVRFRVTYQGRPLLHNEVVVGPGWPGADGPAGVGAARVLGTVLLVGAPARRLLSLPPVVGPALPGLPGVAQVTGVRAVGLQLGADAVIVSALGDRWESLHAVLAELSGSKRPSAA
jgi:urease accessory protein